MELEALEVLVVWELVEAEALEVEAVVVNLDLQVNLELLHLVEQEEQSMVVALLELLEDLELQQEELELLREELEEMVEE